MSAYAETLRLLEEQMERPPSAAVDAMLDRAKAGAEDVPIGKLRARFPLPLTYRPGVGFFLDGEMLAHETNPAGVVYCAVARRGSLRLLAAAIQKYPAVKNLRDAWRAR